MRKQVVTPFYGFAAFHGEEHTVGAWEPADDLEFHSEQCGERTFGTGIWGDSPGAMTASATALGSADHGHGHDVDLRLSGHQQQAFDRDAGHERAHVHA